METKTVNSQTLGFTSTGTAFQILSTIECRIKSINEHRVRFSVLFVGLWGPYPPWNMEDNHKQTEYSQFALLWDLFYCWVASFIIRVISLQLSSIVLAQCFSSFTRLASSSMQIAMGINSNINAMLNAILLGVTKQTLLFISFAIQAEFNNTRLTWNFFLKTVVRKLLYQIKRQFP